MSSEVAFSTSLANPYIRAVIRKHILDIDFDSTLARKVVEVFTGDSVSGSGIIPDAIVRSHLTAHGALDEEIENILSKCREYIELGKNIDGFIKPFEMFYKRKLVASILKESNNSPDDTATEIVRRMQSIKRIDTEIVRVDILGQMDVNKVLEEEMGDNSTFPSCFNIIHKAMPLHGYMRGQVIQICGRPAGGKSLFLMNESICFAKDGKKGLYVCLGDLMYLDLMTRFASIISKVPLSETARYPNKYWTKEVIEILNNLKVIVVPAGTVDADELADIIESRVQQEENLDFVMVDYDSNFAKTTEGMYQEGDAVYNKMTSIARPSKSQFRVVCIASQPKQQYWDYEIIPMSAAAESARKQAIIDIMITLGKATSKQKNCGIINIAKNRRGKTGDQIPYMIEEWGEVKEINEEQYAMLKSYSSEDNNKKQFRANY